MLKRVLWLLLLIIVVVAGITGLRAARLRPPATAAIPLSPIRPDAAALAQRLAAAVRFQTISSEDGSAHPDTALRPLLDFLRSSYPRTFAQLQEEPFTGPGLLLKWPGRDPQALPVLLAAHLDVVPVEAGTELVWQHAPFSGDIADGFVWGRGTLDDKGVALAILEAVEAMLGQGVQPRRTIYLAFGGDEEVGGEQGARRIAEALQRQGVTLDYVLDEGLVITDGFVAGLRKPAALIGIGQKGYATFTLTATGPGGHSSVPEERNPLVLVARAVDRIAAAPPSLRMTEPVRQMLEALAPEMSPPLRLALGNLWLTEPLVKQVFKAKPATRAQLETVVSPTVFESGTQDNVVPQQARAQVNVRTLPGDSTEQVRQRLVRLIADPRVEIAVNPGAAEPTTVSDASSPGYRNLAGAIHAEYPDVAVAPGLVMGLTDSRHYAGIARNIYRFAPLRLRPEDLARIHGANERVGIGDYTNSVRFFATLMAAP